MNQITLPFVLDMGEEVWRLYAVDFACDGKEYSTYVYAKSRDHAARMAQGLRDTADIRGVCIGEDEE